MATIDQIYGAVGAHPGSWNVGGIPLPDFGATEKVSDAFGQSRNSQGGSQLRQGTVLNVGNVPYNPTGGQFNPAAVARNTDPTPGSTGAPAGMNYNSQGTAVQRDVNSYDPNNLQDAWGSYGNNREAYDAAQSAHAQSLADIDRAIALLGEGIPANEASLVEQEGLIESSKQTNLSSLRNNVATQQTGLSNRKVQNQQNYDTAANEARRQASEILQGIQSRYGGTTGEGSFASALLGGQTQRSMSGLNQTFQNNQKEIEDKIGQVQEVARIGEEQINNYAQEQGIQAKQWLQGTLDSIRANQSQLASHKADLSFAAMQQYQQFVQQVELNKQNLYSNLVLQRDKATQYLQGQGQQLSSLGNPQLGAYNGVVQSPITTQGGGQAFTPGAGSFTNQSNQTDWLKQLQGQK